MGNTFINNTLNWKIFNFLINPGSVLEKNLTGGLGLFFGSEIFYILIFFGFGKISLFLRSEDFSLIFMWFFFILIQFIEKKKEEWILRLRDICGSGWFSHPDSLLLSYFKCYEFLL